MCARVNCESSLEPGSGWSELKEGMIKTRVWIHGWSKKSEIQSSKFKVESFGSLIIKSLLLHGNAEEGRLAVAHGVSEKNEGMQEARFC